MTTKRILLWTAPRCVSTAFERSIMTLKDSKVFHEPYSAAFYFGPDRQSLRYALDPIAPKETYRSVGRTLQKDYDGIEVLFSKDMAYCVQNKFELFLDEGFKDFQHSFLIRDPAKAIPSLYRASTNPKLTGWSYFDPEETGFRQMMDLYKFITANLETRPVVVDADDLLQCPSETMKSYCQATGIAYEPRMVTWEPGPVPDWDIWTGWHEDALKSSGFTPRSHRKPRNSCPDVELLPQDVQKAIEKARPCYEFLAARKVNVQRATGSQ